MFIATAITNQSQLLRSEIKPLTDCAPCIYGPTKRKQPRIYKHFIPTGLMGPRNLPGKQEVGRLFHRGKLKLDHYRVSITLTSEITRRIVIGVTVFAIDWPR